MKTTETKNLVLNVGHLMFLHGLVESIGINMNSDDAKGSENFKNYIQDITVLLEEFIDSSDANPELAVMLNYKQSKNNKNGVSKSK